MVDVGPRLAPPMWSASLWPHRHSPFLGLTRQQTEFVGSHILQRHTTCIFDVSMSRVRRTAPGKWRRPSCVAVCLSTKSSGRASCTLDRRAAGSGLRRMAEHVGQRNSNAGTPFLTGAITGAWHLGHRYAPPAVLADLAAPMSSPPRSINTSRALVSFWNTSLSPPARSGCHFMARRFHALWIASSSFSCSLEIPRSWALSDGDGRSDIRPGCFQ